MEGTEQSFPVLDDRLIQVPGVTIQSTSLFAERVDDPWMAMAHVRHIVIGIQVAFAINIVDPDALATNQLQRFLVEKRGVPPQNADSPFQ